LRLPLIARLASTALAALVVGRMSVRRWRWPADPADDRGAEPGPTATLAAEEAIGAREHPRILDAFGGVYEDPELETRLVAMLRQVIAASDEPGRVYRLTLLDSASVNAFALPGGYLYVTRGLLALANDEAEVAAVVAHEIGHVTRRHAIAREQEVRTAALIDRVLTDVLSDPSAAQMAVLANGVSLAQFSQNQELEADELGVRTVGRAGYDPYAAARFLETMARFSALDALPGEAACRAFCRATPLRPPVSRRRCGWPASSARRALGPPSAIAIWTPSMGWCSASRPIRAWCAGAGSCIRRLGIAFEAPAGLPARQHAAGRARCP
jgi:predicted Zn-dependent protease